MRQALLSCFLVVTACGQSSPSASSTSPSPSSSASSSARAAARASGSASSEDEVPNVEEGKYGSLVDEKEFATGIAVLPPSAFKEPPTAVGASLPPKALLANLPAVAMQGTKRSLGWPGSCEAQSFGYGLGTYTAARAPDGHQLWDASLPENEPSAAFLYAWQQKIAHAKCGDGSGATPYLARLVSIGAPSAADVPYKSACPYLTGSSYLDKPYTGEERFRIGSFATLSIQGGNIALIKELLAAGNAIAFSGRVLKNPDHLPVDNDVVYVTDVIPGSGHGMILVGYDDTKGRPDKPGAFLIQNSVGGDWGPDGNGRMWWSYDTFMKTQFLGATAYPRDPSPPTGAILHADGKAPAGSITRAFQWAPDDKRTIIVLMHHFAEAILIQSITLTSPGKKSMKATLNQFVQSGYTHFNRTDGKSFAPGEWGVSITGEDAAGAKVSYSGKIKLGEAAPNPNPKGQIEGDIRGPAGGNVVVE